MALELVFFVQGPDNVKFEQKIQVQGPQISQISFDRNEIRASTVTHLDIAKAQKFEFRSGRMTFG
jgi:hypothetical protein